MENLIPFDQTNKNAIACASSNEYVPYLAVYLQSIIKHSSDTKYYDIIILETDITEQNKNKILNMNKNSNISIRFHNVSELFEKLDLHIEYAYFAKQCYFRLAAGKIFNNYNKVLFTDIDLIANFDFDLFFEINMKNRPVAACKEVLWTKKNRKYKIQSGKNVSDYILNTIKTSEYYNTGVLLIDIKKFNKYVSFEQLIKIGLENSFINQEQDVLNQVFSNKFYTLDFSYNYEVIRGDWGGEEPSCEEYAKVIDQGKVYHFLTSYKVWFYPDSAKGNLWWSYAKQTPFYEEMLQRMVKFQASHTKQPINDVTQLRDELVKVHFLGINKHFAKNEKELKLIFVMNHLWHFKFKKIQYKIKKAFAFGKRYDRYNTKYKIAKDLVRDAKKFKKWLLTI